MLLRMSSKRTAAFPTGALQDCFFVNQNGLLQPRPDSPPTTTTTTTVATTPTAVELRASPYKSSGGHGGVTQRPTKLTMGVNMVRDEDDGGSLPCTPEFPGNDELDTLTGETRRLIHSYLAYVAGLSSSSSSSSSSKRKQEQVQATMARVVQDVLEKHQYAFNGMIKKMNLDDRGEDMSFVTSVAESLFSDGTTNWGRVASLVAFGASVSQNLKSRGMDHCVRLVADEISTYLLSHQREWLVKNQSWDGFAEFFRVADHETTVRNTLMAMAGFAGIGATIALLIR
ncbi:unnamed protein product [Merluccius merluccius]